MVQSRSIVVLEPTGEPIEESIGKTVGLDSLKGKRIVAMWNKSGAADGKTMLLGLLDLLVERYGVSEVKFLSKAKSSMPDSDERMDEIASQADAVLNGIGN